MAMWVLKNVTEYRLMIKHYVHISSENSIELPVSEPCFAMWLFNLSLDI